MPNPFDGLAGPVRDLHDKAGWPGTIHNYAWEPTDDADSSDWMDDDPVDESNWSESTMTATIRIEWGMQEEQIRGPAGREIEGGATIYINPTEADVTGGGGEQARATEITDSKTGARYRVARVRDREDGLLACDVERIA